LALVARNDTFRDLNTASGFQALSSNVAGANNTAVGAKALKKSAGTKNIGIGFQAGVSLVNGNNNIYIGNQGAGDGSQTIRIGTAQTQTFIAGINAASVGDAQVMVDTTTGQLGIVTSSARYKQDIETMASRTEGLLRLRPVTFVYKDDASAAPRYGLIAEEVATVDPELVTRTAAGEVQTVKYHELIPMLLNELQRDHQTRQVDRAEMASLRKELAELRAVVGARPGQ
jgi:Chaperone of endosialidase